MQRKDISYELKAVEGIRFLLCDSAGKSEIPSTDGQWARSPVQCLNMALDEDPGIIAVRFVEMPMRERAAQVELCAALKSNRRTQNTPLVALLHARHRGLMEDLARARVDFIKFLGETTLTSALMIEIIDALGPQDRIGHWMTVVCPCLHYKRIDPRHELTVCGGYRDRMVLGGRRLREICHTVDHLHCEYFLNARLRP